MKEHLKDLELNEGFALEKKKYEELPYFDFLNIEIEEYMPK